MENFYFEVSYINSEAKTYQEDSIEGEITASNVVFALNKIIKNWKLNPNNISSITIEKKF